MTPRRGKTPTRAHICRAPPHPPHSLRAHQPRTHRRHALVPHSAQTRGEADYKCAPCPLGDHALAPDQRGRVGQWRAIDGVFAPAPCFQPACLARMKERQKRLDAKPPLTLYHLTSVDAANSIYKSGGTLQPLDRVDQ